MQGKNPHIIISGGGTGGHIFPAIAIGHAIIEKLPQAEILFVGAEGKMEMEKVPEAGFNIIGLPVAGFQRRLTFKNLLFPFKLLLSMLKALGVVNKFKPDVAVGVGGYASGPVLKAANWKGVKTVVQEQNSFAGVTNKILAKSASKICVAYEDMERFFPLEKIRLTGNPIREQIRNITVDASSAKRAFGLDVSKKVILVIGGSLGARTINNSIKGGLEKLQASGHQVLWQTGAFYYDDCLLAAQDFKDIHPVKFIKEMDKAYSSADLVVSRAGALSISELCVVGKPAILVPSPNVAEDHQTHNAMSLVDREAAVLVRDADAETELINRTLQLLESEAEMKRLGGNILKMAKPDAAQTIANEIIELLK